MCLCVLHKVPVLPSAVSFSVDVREDPVGDAPTVGVPRQSVFGPTLSLITGLSVNQQHSEVYDIEIRQDM